MPYTCTYVQLILILILKLILFEYAYLYLYVYLYSTYSSPMLSSNFPWGQRLALAYIYTYLSTYTYTYTCPYVQQQLSVGVNGWHWREVRGAMVLHSHTGRWDDFSVKAKFHLDR